ncbi:MAG: HTTM domain-containing protein [Chloroflexota bacterium]
MNPDYNFFRWQYWFGEVDTRPLAVFRILFSLTLLKNALYHLPLSYRFYSEDGFLPPSVLDEVWRTDWRISPLEGLPAAWMVTGVFVLWTVVIVLLLVGYRTRVMAILNFVLMLVIHERNPFVLNGADVLMRALSFWMMFVPLADYYAVDAFRKRWDKAARTQRLEHLRPNGTVHKTFALPFRLMQSQVALVYLFTFLLKLPGDSWTGGDAVYQALQLDAFLLPTGAWLVEVGPQWLFRYMTHMSLIAEGLFVLLVFSPLLQPSLRIVGLTLTGLMHVGIGLLMAVPDFSILMITTYVLFFEPAWILRLTPKQPERQLSMPVPHPGSPLWLLVLLTRTSYLKVTGGSQIDHFDGWFIEDEYGESYISRDAYLLAAHLLPVSVLWRWTLRWRWVRKTIWTLLAFYVSRLPTVTGAPCIVKEPTLVPYMRFIARAAMTAALVPLFLAVLQWNLSNVQFNNRALAPQLTGPARGAVLVTGLYQGWSMFSPFPANPHGWVRVAAVFEDTSEMELTTAGPLHREIIHWRYGPEGRMRKYNENIREGNKQPLLSAMASHYCRYYNRHLERPAGERLATLEIQFFERHYVDYGQPRNPYTTTILWKHWCFDEYQY